MCVCRAYVRVYKVLGVRRVSGFSFGEKYERVVFISRSGRFLGFFVCIWFSSIFRSRFSLGFGFGFVTYSRVVFSVVFRE